MADAFRDETDVVERRLLDRGQQFDFRQVVTLLQRLALARGRSPDTAIHLRPALGLDLARSDVVGIQQKENGDYDVVVSFLSLYGVSSPLPTFYTEDLIVADQEDKPGARAFLDIIHQRLYQLFIEAISKYRPMHAMVGMGNDAYSQLLAGFAGLRDPRLRQAFPDPWLSLPYLSLLSTPRRSASGLKTLLQHALRDVEVSIDQCVERRVRIPDAQRFSLGEQANCIGTDCLLGDSLIDYTGKIVIEIGPLSANRFNALLNHGDEWGVLVSLTQYYLNVPVACELSLLLSPGEAASTQLGIDAWAQLGRNTWLFADEQTGATRACLQLA